MRISSRSVTGYTFLSLRSLAISFKHSGFFGKVAHFLGSEWPSIMIAFTLLGSKPRQVDKEHHRRCCMHVIYKRCAAGDVHKKTVVMCVLLTHDDGSVEKVV